MKKWIEKAPKQAKQQVKKEAVVEEDDLFGDSPAPTEPKPKPQAP